MSSSSIQEQTLHKSAWLIAGANVAFSTEGQLEITTPIGGFRDGVPLAYQYIEGQRVNVPMAYNLSPSSSPSVSGVQRDEAKSRTGKENLYGFDIGLYNTAQPLILDPAIIIYSGYIGGNGNDWGNGIAVNGVGNAFITGETASTETSFPISVGPDLTFNGDIDAFVAKVNIEGTGLVYAGYIGGNGYDWGGDITVDSADNAYIVGGTSSTEASFPINGGPDLTYNGDEDAFVAKVNTTGTDLIYAGYIGGNSLDRGRGIAVDGSGIAYI